MDKNELNLSSCAVLVTAQNIMQSATTTLTSLLGKFKKSEKVDYTAKLKSYQIDIKALNKKIAMCRRATRDIIKKYKELQQDYLSDAEFFNTRMIPATSVSNTHDRSVSKTRNNSGDRIRNNKKNKSKTKTVDMIQNTFYDPDRAREYKNNAFKYKELVREFKGIVKEVKECKKQLVSIKREIIALLKQTDISGSEVDAIDKSMNNLIEHINIIDEDITTAESTDSSYVLDYIYDVFSEGVITESVLDNCVGMILS